MKKLRGLLKGKDKRNIIAIMAVIILAFAVSGAMISCSSDKSSADTVKGSTILQTNEKGETVVVATDKDGETVIYETDKKGNVKESKKSSTKAAATTKAKSTTAAPTVAPTTKATQVKNICYVTVDGYCSGKAITLQGGDTAYSVLIRTGASVSGSSSYVKGINGLFEFDKGPTSGWMYSVNGYTPNVGCGSYSVKTGDSVRWYYVTSY